MFNKNKIKIVLLTLLAFYAIVENTKGSNVASGMGNLKGNKSNVMIDQEVIDSLSTKEEVPVIIDLKQPDPIPKNMDVLKQMVAKEQQAVLDTLSKEDFRLAHRFEVLFGFSGYLRRSGLIKLKQNPNVQRILLDKEVRIQ